MFWWYWSVRQRLMLLAAVLLPVVGFFAFRVLLGDGPQEASPSAADQSQPLPEVAAPKSELLVLTADDSRSAARAFPRTFGDFGEGSVSTRNMIFPGMSYDEYSVYLFFRSASEPDAQVPADAAVTVTTLAPEGASTSSASVPAPQEGTTVETILEALRWRFNERGGVARIVESRSGVELFVTGLEGSRGYQGTLRFQVVPGGVVVRGVVKEVPANEVNDVIAESQAQDAPAAGSVPAPAEQTEAPAEGSSSTVPVTTVP